MIFFVILLIFLKSSSFSDDFEILRKQAQSEFKKIIYIVDNLKCRERDEVINKFFKRYGEENIYSFKLSKYTIKRCIKNSKMGFCCDDGEEVIPCEYDYVSPFYEGYSVVRKNDKWGILDLKGNKVIDIIHNRKTIRKLVDEMRKKFVENRLLYTYQIKLKKLIFEEGEVVKLVVGDKVGFTDKDGNFIIPLKYESAKGFSYDLAPVMLNKKWGFINIKDKVIIPFIYQEAEPFFEGRAAVKLNGKWGFVDINGNLVVKNKYDFVFYFNEMRAVVVLNGRYGFIDYEGNEIVKPTFDDLTTFNCGIAEVRDNSNLYYIDRWGNIIFKRKIY
ncbi:MAG: WG repeat-containing protein [Elusimicrobiales bacterium]|nr:WG repeat-containing protein [Elusimicrobiales bacterium]